MELQPPSPVMQNSKSGHAGVHWYKRDKNWVARISINGKRKHLGYFQDKGEAIERRLKAETEKPRASRRPILVQPDDPTIKLVPLTKGQAAIVDADRFEWAMQWNWYAMYCRQTRSHYAARRGRCGEPKTVFLHRQLQEEPSEVDHINGNTLDCRMANLRPCTHAQNCANRKPYRNNTSGNTGVYRDRNWWRAEITCNDRDIFLGLFATKEEAIAARKAGELKHWGEFAYSRREHQPPKKPPVSEGAASVFAASYKEEA